MLISTLGRVELERLGLARAARNAQIERVQPVRVVVTVAWIDSGAARARL